MPSCNIKKNIPAWYREENSDLYNPQSGKLEPLFEALNPVWTVCCTNDNLVHGYKGASVYYTVEAQDENEAVRKAMINPKFTEHLEENFTERDLKVYKPIGLYIIGEIKYYKGDPRL